MSARTIHIASLGCPKNRVDSEVMLGVALAAGYRHAADPRRAEVIVVNTCGFIGPAKRESIDAILELGEHKRRGRCRKLVVAGCLAQRYPRELAAELPMVDHFLGSSDILALGAVLAGRAERIGVGDPGSWLMNAGTPRVLSSALSPSASGSAYVKLGEGCSRRCAFCVIPELRGRQRSREPADVVREVERLAAQGVKEVNLVSQDTVAYGRDLPAGSRASLSRVAERVADVPGVRWVRLLYLYPERLSPDLLALLAGHEKVLPYVDMPMQHASDRLLRLMRRGHGGRALRQLIEQLRTAVPGLVLRSAFIVGHPGETPADFEELCELVRWAEIDRVGVFRYSDEEGTAASRLGGKVPPLVAANRWRRLMAIARRISRVHNRALRGRELEILVEGPSDEHEHVLMGRHAGQAPEIDGQVYLGAGAWHGAAARAGEMIRVRISQSSDYDLVGEVRGWRCRDRQLSCH
ncbi:MAG: 30S ribosomal protein S12 methylthiotransferase RimO [Deltaproteobacteria bacterium]|nr:30S ribosomal protein S12 methylthiotransferase RimO [Deltaproteobacteria bacterium]